MAARLLYASFWAGFPVPNLPSPDPRTRELVSGRDSRGLRQRPRSGEAGRTRSPLTLHPPRRRRGRGKRRAPGRDLIHTDAGPGALAGPGPARLAQRLCRVPSATENPLRVSFPGEGQPRSTAAIPLVT